MSKKNFFVDNTIFSPATRYKQLNTNNMIIQNGAATKSIEFKTDPLLQVDYSLLFPSSAPLSGQTLVW